MKYRSYNREVKIATGLVMNLFNNIVISRFDRNMTAVKDISVPIVYGVRSRVLKELENHKKTIKPPILAIVKEDLTRDDVRFNEVYSYKKDAASGHNPLSRMRGIPVNIEFTLSGIAAYEDDLDQLITNFVLFFKPDVFVSWKHPRYPTQEIKSQVVWKGSIEYQSPVEVSTEDREFWQFSTTFTFKTWFFPGINNLNQGDDNSPVIMYVNHSGNLFFETGDAGYSMHGIYAVPHTISFADYMKTLNDGGVDDDTYDVVSYPRAVVSPDVDASLCYPVSTREPAVTLKITLLGEDKDDENYDPFLFRFDDESLIGDCGVWRTKMAVSRDEGVNGIRYVGSGAWADEYVEFSATTSLDSNYERLRKFPDSPYISCPRNIDNLHSKYWDVRGNVAEPNAIIAAFDDSATEYVAGAFSHLEWRNLVGRKLNVKRICLTAGANFAQTPNAFTLEGYSDADKSWSVIRRIATGEWTSAGEMKCFDDETDEHEYDALRLTFGNPQSGEGQISLKNFRCYAVLDYSEAPAGYKTSKISASSYGFSFKAAGDEDSLIVLRRDFSTSSTPGDDGITESFGSAITLADNDKHLLGRPNLEHLLPVHFRTMRYLMFWYKGRKYGISLQGKVDDSVGQTITYGGHFPSSASDGSIHILDDEPGSPIYQYDEEENTWFEIGNQTRPGFHRITTTASSGDNSVELNPGEYETYSFSQYFTNKATNYFVAYLSSDVGGQASVLVKSGDCEATVEVLDLTNTPTLFRLPFEVFGNIESVVFTLSVVGTSVGQITVSGVEITGELSEGDTINNPSEADVSALSFLKSVH